MNIPTNYPEHISDPIRVQITQELALHEFKKLFPNLSPEEIEKIDKDIHGWYEKPESYNLSTVRDFWNGIDGIMTGFKLKNIIPLITAENIRWSEETINVAQIVFGVNLGGIADDFKTRNKSSDEIMANFDSNPNLYKKAKSESDKNFRGTPRENDRIIVISRPGEKLKVHDGNGRLMRATIYSKTKIDVFIGTYPSNNDKATNYWVPTGYLMRLTQLSLNGKEEALSLIISILQSSECARFEFFKRAINADEPKEAELRELVADKLGITKVTK